MTQNKVYIYGRHALMEAISHTPKAIEEIFVSSQFDDSAIMEVARKANIKIGVFSGNKVWPRPIPAPRSSLGVPRRGIRRADGANFFVEESAPPTHLLVADSSPSQSGRGILRSYNKMPRDFDPHVVHQGIIGLLSLDRLVRPFEEFAKILKVGQETCLALLGEISDPQNVGAIIRSAAAFGVSAVLIPEHNQAQITGSVIKVSAGMAFKIPLISVPNVNSAVRDLKEKGFWVYGLEGESKQSITNEKFDAPTVFILGNEEKGIRHKTRELCDILLSIPIDSRCESLNVATSASVAFYAWSARHQKAVKNVRK